MKKNMKLFWGVFILICLSTFSCSNSQGSVPGFGIDPPAPFNIVINNGNYVLAGTAIVITVTAVNPNGSTNQNFSGPVTLSTTDTTANLPATVIMLNGIATFTNVIFNTPGYPSITLTKGAFSKTRSLVVYNANSNIGTFVGAIGNLSGAAGSSLFSGTLCSTLVSIFPNAAPSWCTGGTFTTGSGSGGTYNSPQNMLVDSRNNLMYVTDSNQGRIVKLQLSTGAFIAAIGKISGTVPVGCFVNGSNVTTGWCTSPAAVYTTGETDGAFDDPLGLAMDSQYLYVTNATGSYARLERISLATGAFAGAIGRISGTVPAGCSVDREGNQVTTTWCTGASYVGGSASADGAFYNPRNLAIATDNSGTTYLYVADSQMRAERYILSSGFFAGAIGQTNSQSSSPTTFTSSSAPLCANNVNPLNNNITTRWCTGGNFTVAAPLTPDDGSFFDTSGMAVDPANNRMYVSNTPGAYFGPQRIQQFTLSTGTFIGAIGYSTAVGSGANPCQIGINTTWCTGGTFGNPSTTTLDGMFNDTTQLAIDLVHGFLYTSDGSSHRIQKLTTSTGTFVGSIGLTGASAGTCPSGAVATSWCTGGVFSPSSSGSGDGMYNNEGGIAIDPVYGFLYAADRGNNRIVKIQ